MGKCSPGRKFTPKSDSWRSSLRAERFPKPQLCVHTTAQGCLHSTANCAPCQGSPRTGQDRGTPLSPPELLLVPIAGSAWLGQPCQGTGDLLLVTLSTGGFLVGLVLTGAAVLL